MPLISSKSRPTRRAIKDLGARRPIFLQLITWVVQFVLAVPTLLLVVELFVFGWSPDTATFRVLHRPTFSCSNVAKEVEGDGYIYETKITVEGPLVSRFLPKAFIRNQRISIEPNGQGYIQEIKLGREIAKVNSRYAGDKKIMTSFNFSYRFIGNEDPTITLRRVSPFKLGEEECSLRVESEY